MNRTALRKGRPPVPCAAAAVSAASFDPRAAAAQAATAIAAATAGQPANDREDRRRGELGRSMRVSRDDGRWRASRRERVARMRALFAAPATGTAGGGLVF